MMFYKLMFFSTLMLGSMISISANSWFMMWMGLEINLISIIPLFKTPMNTMSSESAIKYFITQALASMLIIFSIILFNLISEMNFLMETSYLNLILDSALLTKMGAAPFHFWFPEVIEGLNWLNCFIMLTWQKIAPMFLLMYNSTLSSFMFMVILTSMIIGGLMGFNQTSIRKILAFSSINHIGWMLSIMFNSQSIWITYFMIYTLINLNIILIFKMFNIFYLNQFHFNLNNNFMTKLFFSMNFLSLGGLPPFLGFLPKWLTINFLISSKFYFLSFLMIILTLITLYFYIRITFSSILIMTSKSLINKTSVKNFWILKFNFIALFSLILYSSVFLML